MSSTVIRDFLVALTFKTDDSGAAKNLKMRLIVMRSQQSY
jgi:hypothetical protein